MGNLLRQFKSGVSIIKQDSYIAFVYVFKLNTKELGQIVI